MNESTRKRVLFVVLGLAVVWGAWNFTHPRKPRHARMDTAGVVASPAVDSVSAVTPTVAIEAKRAESWGRDPFHGTTQSRTTTGESSVNRVASVSRPSEPGWALTGILYSATSPVAFINGRMVKVGDTISLAHVVRIDKQKVTLSHNGREFDLFVNKG